MRPFRASPPPLNSIPPFLALGVGIALAIALLIVFSYVLFWGLVIGGILWALNGLIRYCSKVQAQPNPTSTPKGRIIEHDDLN